MRTFAKLCAALIVAATWLFMSNAPADAHNWRRHCHHHSYHHHHWHRHCGCHAHRHHHHWCHHHWRQSRGDDYGSGTVSTVPSGQCKARLDGIATGTGVFGLGSARARAAAIADFETKAANLYGANYGHFSRARGARWDCSKLAIIKAKCVVTASPCL